MPNKYKSIYRSSYHPKLILIKFKSKLRIIIGTPNFYIGDWFSWSNIFYMRDFAYISKK